MEAVTASDRAAQRWHFVVDNLDTHRSESLVRWVARESGLELELGKKGKWGILANRESRAAFLSDPSHRIVFHYTPKHTSWMNQVEIWLSILVAETATARVLQIGHRSETEGVGLHRLLQPDHGKAIQMDLPREGVGRINLSGYLRPPVLVTADCRSQLWGLAECSFQLGISLVPYHCWRIARIEHRTDRVYRGIYVFG